MFVIFMWLVGGLIFGSICSGMAKNRRRGAGLWFWLGFFFGIFAVFGILLLSEQEARR